MSNILKGDSLMTEQKKATGPTGRIPVALLMMMAGVLLVTAGCANTNNRDNDSRGGSLLILDQLNGKGSVQGETDQEGTEIASDVWTCDEDHQTCTILNDRGVAHFRNEVLNPTDPTTGGTTGSSYFQDIQLYRVRVVYTRADGFNREGIDVPYSYDSVMASTVPVGEQLTVEFTIVRHTAKMERPLIDLLGGLGAGNVINTNTRCDFWGRDIAGNDHHVYGFIPIDFADWGP